MALTDVLDILDPTSRAIVLFLVVASLAAITIVVTQKNTRDTKWVVAAVVGGFFIIDLFYIHPEVWENAPSLFYWVAKPFWVGVPMFFVAMWLMRNTLIDNRVVMAAAGLIGIVVLQLYYTVIPIPVVDGPSVQIGLIGNLTEGVRVHGAALLVSLVAVVAGMELTGE